MANGPTSTSRKTSLISGLRARDRCWRPLCRTVKLSVFTRRLTASAWCGGRRCSAGSNSLSGSSRPCSYGAVSWGRPAIRSHSASCSPSANSRKPLDVAVYGGEWSASPPPPTLPWEKILRYPLDRRLGRP